MRKLNRAFATDVVARLEALPKDLKPAWGELTRDGVIAHLAGGIEYSMQPGRSLPHRRGLFAMTMAGGGVRAAG